MYFSEEHSSTPSPCREDRHSAWGLSAVTHRTCDFLVMGCFLFPSTVPAPLCLWVLETFIRDYFFIFCKLQKVFFTSRPSASIMLLSPPLQTFPQHEDSQLHLMANVNRWGSDIQYGRQKVTSDRKSEPSTVLSAERSGHFLTEHHYKLAWSFSNRPCHYH